MDGFFSQPEGENKKGRFNAGNFTVFMNHGALWRKKLFSLDWFYNTEKNLRR